MRPRYLVFITVLAVCHLQLGAQTLTNAEQAAQRETRGAAESLAAPTSDALPDDPGQEIVPLAVPERAPATGTPVEWEALRQEWVGDTLTLTGDVVVHYRDYVIRADKVVYNRTTTELEADGHLAGHRRAQRCADQRHARRYAPQHAHRALLQRERIAGRAHRGAHGCLLHTDSAAVLGPGAAANRRGQLSN